jgi:hypothetical protein
MVSSLLQEDQLNHLQSNKATAGMVARCIVPHRGSNHISESRKTICTAANPGTETVMLLRKQERSKNFGTVKSPVFQ